MHDRDPGKVFATLYDLISGPATRVRPWSEVRELFYPGALLHSELTLPDGSVHSGTWDVDAFCAEAEEEYKRQGFWEREVASRTERFGSIASVWSTYETRVDDPQSDPVGRGINAVHLLHRGGRWRITALIFQNERGTRGIPQRYLSS